MDDWMQDPVDDARPELNLTSLVDVVFALLVVFMVSSAAMVEEGRTDAASGQIELALPTGDSRVNAKPPGELVLQVDADGSLFSAGKPTDAKTLASEVVKQLVKTPNLQVRIEAHSKLSYQRVMDVIAKLQALGVRNVGLATRTSEGAAK
ncbi:MAG: biopolymer transporter ExbD [Myxococcales bacterium]|nr:biopolymer transporter ExbD [Myxococcales bacterium]